MDKSVFLHWWFSFDLQYYLILGGTNNVLHISVKYFLCTLWSLALAKKSSNNINNSHAQVSRLCYFLWLCLKQVSKINHVFYWFPIVSLLKLKLKKQIKTILTFRMKTTSISKVVLKQAMDELTETNNFNLWKQR